MSAACSTSRRGWPLERVLFALAGSVTLLGAAPVALPSPCPRAAAHIPPTS
jgi:hypothetical protein